MCKCGKGSLDTFATELVDRAVNAVERFSNVHWVCRAGLHDETHWIYRAVVVQSIQTYIK